METHSSIHSAKTQKTAAPWMGAAVFYRSWGTGSPQKRGKKIYDRLSSGHNRGTPAEAGNPVFLNPFRETGWTARWDDKARPHIDGIQDPLFPKQKLRFQHNLNLICSSLEPTWRAHPALPPEHQFSLPIQRTTRANNCSPALPSRLTYPTER